MTDSHELMRRIADGDFGAFEELYDGQHRLVYGIAVRMLERPALAEDLTQEIFTKIWTDPLAFRGGNLVGWIARMTRNRAIDMLRRVLFASKANSPKRFVSHTLPTKRRLRD